MVVENKVYNVTNFVKIHPGGKIITQYAGMDATDVFYAFHGHDESFPGWESLSRYQVGELDEPLKLAPHIEDFRKLRTELIQDGYFEPDYLWYFVIFSIIMAFYAFGIALLWWLPHTWFTIILSGMFDGIITSKTSLT